jgi:hypothetical protein
MEIKKANSEITSLGFWIPLNDVGESSSSLPLLRYMIIVTQRVSTFTASRIHQGQSTWRNTSISLMLSVNRSFRPCPASCTRVKQVRSSISAEIRPHCILICRIKQGESVSSVDQESKLIFPTNPGLSNRVNVFLLRFSYTGAPFFSAMGAMRFVSGPVQTFTSQD